MLFKLLSTVCFFYELLKLPKFCQSFVKDSLWLFQDCWRFFRTHPDLAENSLRLDHDCLNFFKVLWNQSRLFKILLDLFKIRYNFWRPCTTFDRVSYLSIIPWNSLKDSSRLVWDSVRYCRLWSVSEFNFSHCLSLYSRLREGLTTVIWGIWLCLPLLSSDHLIFCIIFFFLKFKMFVSVATSLCGVGTVNFPNYRYCS